ncbi:MAG: hypothetical protein ACE5JB_09025 [bacterium]
MTRNLEVNRNLEQGDRNFYNSPLHQSLAGDLSPHAEPAKESPAELIHPVR